jgi:predicted TIM-barrel fold metal-dependent hydrolase
VALTQRAMDAMGLDYMVVFPTPMLSLGMHPQPDAEVALGKAFNRWMVEKILPQDPRQKALLYLPFNTPEACVEMVEEFAGKPGVIGFSVASTRHRPVHHNDYMPLYAALQDHGMPLGFHAGFTWHDQSLQQLNRFIAMHSISFVHFNMVHMTNWIINGLPERFPKLKVIWIESGVAWVPFIMQRLDSEYMMRVSEAPLLKRLPSDYMREMYFTSQPLERSNMKLTQAAFEAMHADTQLLFASDWPHWDFDAPSSIMKLPFLNEQAKRNILGLNAARLFDLPVPPEKSGVMARQPEAVPAE